MVDVGFSIGGICACVVCTKFFKTHPLCNGHFQREESSYFSVI